jgi:tetratricopeptide (TPR) repeat protein
MKKIFITGFALILFSVNHLCGQTLSGNDKSVKIWEESINIPTYLFDPPSLNPMFYDGSSYQGAQGRIYPYPLNQSLTNRKVDQKHNMVYLENEFIKVDISPEIGGRVWGALDKSDNYDFVYRQHVIKPQLVGMLGAWLEGGIEWNFPHHHRANAYMPVDYDLQNNPDGSATMWLGEVELRDRMKFMLGVSVYPGKSYFEVTFRPLNSTPFANSFLYFANTSVHANENYQVFFPPSTAFGTYHAKNQFLRWPISHEIFNNTDYTQGVDVSWWKNHPEWTSIFAFNYEDGFFGGYDHGKDAGTVIVSNVNIAPGKKFWEWSNGPRGRAWDKALTDTDGPALELMAGGYSDNQPDYSWLQPYESKYLKQYFYPIRGIGGFKNANIDAVVNLEFPAKGKVKFGFNTTSSRKNARVVLNIDGKIFFEQNIDIDPGHPFMKELGIPENTTETDTKITLLTSDGEELISYQPVKKRDDLPFPKLAQAPKPPSEIGTIEELYQTGLRLTEFRNATVQPYPYYEEALKRDPGDYRVNTALGLLYIRRGLFDEAEKHLQTAVDRITSNYTKPRDGEAYYYLGVCQRFQGKEKEAYKNLYQATWSYAFHSAAYYQLAEIDCGGGNYNLALEKLDRSISTNANNNKAQDLKSAVLRKLGNPLQALEVSGKTMVYDRLDFGARFENYLACKELGKGEESAKVLSELRSKLRGYTESYLELSIGYFNAGLIDEAIDVLSNPGLIPDNTINSSPMVNYYLGYFWSKKGDSSKALDFFNRASKVSPDYCFPFRLEEIGILETAMKLNPSDSKAPYYLGNLLYDFQPEKATAMWEASRKLDESFAMVHRNLGYAYTKAYDDLPKAIASYERAISLNNKDQRWFYDLDLMYAAARTDPAKRLKLLEDNHNTLANDNVIDGLSRELLLQVQLGQYDRALELFNSRSFPQFEGVDRIYTPYLDALLLRGYKELKGGQSKAALKDGLTALVYPTDMLIDQAYREGRTGEVYYFIGLVYEKMGNQKKAREAWKEAIGLNQVSLNSRGEGGSDVTFYRALCLKKLGKSDEADKLFDGLISSGKSRIESEQIDFFEKFGERGTQDDRRSDGHYLMGLGYIGKGMQEEAKQEFSEAVRLNINNIWANKYLSDLNEN